MPICNKCGVEKAQEEFTKDNRKPGGHSKVCQKCTWKRQKEWAEKDKERIFEQRREYRNSHKEEIAEKRKLHT
jgi:protein-arginine kinase activator protein McsA